MPLSRNPAALRALGVGAPHEAAAVVAAGRTVARALAATGAEVRTPEEHGGDSREDNEV
jgi:hypothetical protein